jgi:hypothetical protein
MNEAFSHEFSHNAFSHQGAKPETSEGSKPFNDQMIFSRLPKGYFTQEQEEPTDLVMAQTEIKQMREGFINYVHNSGAAVDQDDDGDDKLEDALDPSKFIEKHFGSEGVEDPEFLFKEIIKEIPDPKEE